MTCFSGGAVGSDRHWVSLAIADGQDATDFTFEGHKPGPYHCVKLTQPELDLADPFVLRANEKIRRRFPTSSLHTNNLLRRNWYQVKDATMVYAICEGYDNVESGGLTNAIVKGGTAWGVQMFLDRVPPPMDMSPPKCWVFFQDTGHWMCALLAADRSQRWGFSGSPPRPSGDWAGIGARNLLPIGAEATRKLFS